MDRNNLQIVISEQSEIVVEGLLSILKGHNPIINIHRIGNLQELEDYCLNHQIHVIIINPSIIANEEKNFSRLRKTYPKISVIALTYQIFPADTMKLFDEVVYITDSYHTIASKIHQAALTDHKVEAHNDDLTDRELDVLKAITKGYSNKEIADHLNISIHTVISHRKNITEKTGIKSISGLTIYAISQKIIPL